MSIKNYILNSGSKPIVLNKHKTHNIQLSLGNVKLNWLFDIEKFSSKIFLVCLVGIFVGTYNFFILERTGLYSLGIASLFQSIARNAAYFLKKGSYEVSARSVHTLLFWGLNLIVNIPLAVLGFKRIGRRFTILTLVYLSVSSLTSMAISSLPNNWGLKDFHIFSDPRTFDTNLLNEGIQILQWNYVTNFKVINSSGDLISSFSMNDSSRVMLIFFYGIVFGLLNTVSSIFVYSLGGSTGGVDWVIYYFLKRQRKRLNTLYFYLSILITFVAYVLGTYVPYVDHTLFSPNKVTEVITSGVESNSVYVTGENTLNNKQHSVISSLLGPMFLATLVAAITKRIMYHFFYPNFKIINVKIYTSHPVELRKQLLQSQFPQSFTINLGIGGLKLKNQTIFEITCFALDLKMLRDLSKSIDPNCLVVAMPVQSLTGRFVVQDNIT